jgi:2-dehydro-3-deoxyphosphogluconate aldolase / (4S)-4-hydroxy-2-oxoglutarate aldolase
MANDPLPATPKPVDATAIMELSPVIPVVTIGDVDEAVPLATALLRGGVSVIEVTLRSPAALAAIDKIRRECPDMCVGAGTVWTAQQAVQAASAGAAFLVSPGIADAVQDFAAAEDLPYLPGGQTASEIAHLVRRGIRAVKFFPAAPAGGPAALATLAAVFDDLKFCPTGGVSEVTAAEYLKLPAVLCVGGSWLATSGLLATRDWARVEFLAKRAAALRAMPGR